MKRTEIIAVGSELLLGEIVNTNAQYLSQQLSKYGFHVLYHVVVGDNVERLKETFERARARSEFVIVTGGLGPTVDDLTKPVLADVLGRKLVHDAQALAVIDRVVSSRGRELVPGDIKQAEILEGAEALMNPVGLAPGIWIEEDVTWMLLPGVPREMKAIVEHVFPSKFSGETIVSESLRFYEIGEAKLDHLVADLMMASNPTVAPYAEFGEARLRISAKAADEVEARDMIERVKENILERVGDYYFGSDETTLAGAALDELRRRGLTLSVCESLSGGRCAEAITAVPGASDVFKGGLVTYSDEVKTALGVSPETLAAHSAVSAEVAREMADRVASFTGTDVALSFTGEAGPATASGKTVGTVYIGVHVKGQTTVFVKTYPHQERTMIQGRVVKDGLWALLQHFKKYE